MRFYLRKFRYNRKRTFILLFLFLSLFGLTIGYALLTRTLAVEGTTNLTKTTWDVHFENININSGSVTATTEPTITDDTTVSFAVTLENPGDFYQFNVDVVNEGTINAKIDSIEILPTLTPEQSAYFVYTVKYQDGTAIAEGQPLIINTSKTLDIYFEYVDLQLPENYPEEDQEFSFSVTINYVQDATAYNPEGSIIKASYASDTTAFRDATYRDNIKNIYLSDIIDEPENTITSWDISANNDGNVMAYLTSNINDNTKYDLYIQGNGHLYANPDSSYLFYNLRGVDKITGMDTLDIQNVTVMRSMFENTGYNSTTFTLDLGSNFDTTGVTDMGYMFLNTGYNSPVFTLNLGNKFNTSSVQNMIRLFAYTGRSSTVFTLNLGNQFDTSNVVDMNCMFLYTGFSSNAFTLNLGNLFDTSNVEDMTSMFSYTGYTNPGFTLNLGSNFDTGKVENMYGMFSYTGYSSTVFTLDLGSHFDTKAVKNMRNMFLAAGYSSPVFTLNLGNLFKTNEVTTMRAMFNSTGYNSTVFTLNLGSLFNTAKVTDMASMFSGTGYSSPVFTLNLGNSFTTPLVTTMDNMFSNIGHANTNLELDVHTLTFSGVASYSSVFLGLTTNNKLYVKDTTEQSWIISNAGNANLTSSNVLIYT